MIRKGHWGVQEEAVQQETREATMAERLMIYGWSSMFHGCLVGDLGVRNYC
jgi:hypothetical protein